MTLAIDSRRGRFALMAGHCAGMIDLVALPVWVGALIGQYGMAPQRAGALATLFLAAVVVASVLLAPRLPKLPARRLATAGFALAAIAFGAAAMNADFAMLALLHVLAGAANGTALSVTHGTLARSARPHRLFAMANLALGVFGVAFFASVPPLIARFGGPALFMVFGGVMAVAALVALTCFPAVAAQPAPVAQAGAARVPLPRAVWFGVAGVSCMTVVQAMTFSFVERVGIDRGFGAAAVQGVLVALGLFNLLPPVLAAVLERRLPARVVLVAAPCLQAALAATLMTADQLPAYAAAAVVFTSVLIFAHTFAFGLIARLDPSGRALAATPAMSMFGSAIGPVLGGTLVQQWGYGGIAVAASVVACLALLAFYQLPRMAPPPALAPSGA